MPDIEISFNDEAKEIAEEMIPEVHQHLRTANIAYLFTTQDRKKAGRVILGTASKLSPVQRFLSSDSGDEGYDFIILFGKNQWDLMTDKKKKAVVDHELCHCSVGSKGWALRGHDVEEFREVIERHGLYKEDVREFAETARQLELPVHISEATLSAAGHSVTMSGEQFHELAGGDE